MAKDRSTIPSVLKRNQASHIARQSTSFSTANRSTAKQACHQCRRRKLVSLPSLLPTPYSYTIPPIQKCDAQRPCATCIRSHANAIQTALPGAIIPERPECTYDELPESQRDRDPIPERTLSAGDGGTRSRYAQLEHRIGISFYPFCPPHTT